MPYDSKSLAEHTARLLRSLRASKPLVQNITNFVSMDVVANALLAIGASPAMVHAPEEVVEFSAFIGALVVNIGTLSQTWVDSMLIATRAAGERRKPWVLDPVGAGATSFRDEAVRKLLANRPAAIRGNASEIIAVARGQGLTLDKAAPKGVDSAHTTDEAQLMAMKLAGHLSCIVVATGEVDLVTDGLRIVRLRNGTPMMTRVTALGCALSAIVGAFLAITEDHFLAAAAAVAVYGVAGEIAAPQSHGPGSFRVAFLDALDSVDEFSLIERLRVIG